jgi:hypothetical protein
MFILKNEKFFFRSFFKLFIKSKKLRSWIPVRVRKSKAFTNTNSKAYSSTKNVSFWYKNKVFLERTATV